MFNQRALLLIISRSFVATVTDGMIFGEGKIVENPFGCEDANSRKLRKNPS